MINKKRFYSFSPYNLVKSFVSEKKFSLLLLGTITSQVINIVLSPILSRIYSPLSFGDFAYFQSWVSIIGTLLFLRMEMSIMTWTYKHRRQEIISFLLTVSVLLTLLSVFIFIGQSKSLLWIALSFINTFFIGINNLFYLIALKDGRANTCSYSRIGRSVIFNSSCLLIGYLLGNNGFYIIVGHTPSLIIENIILIKDEFRTLLNYRFLNLLKIKFYLRKNSNFIKWNMPNVALDLANDFGYMLLISHLFGKEIMGAFAMMYRIIKLPSSFIGSALYQYSFSQAATQKGNVSKIVLKNYLFTFMIGLPFFLCIFIWGQDLFILFFGKMWKDAGTIAEIFAIAYFLNFLISSSSFVTILYNKMNIGFFLTLIDVILKIVCLFIGNYYHNWILAFILSSIEQCIIYICALIIYLNLSRNEVSK